ncbi:hypothetical protein STEG23_018662, partial [Scotinomys teguina]
EPFHKVGDGLPQKGMTSTVIGSTIKNKSKELETSVKPESLIPKPMKKKERKKEKEEKEERWHDGSFACGPIVA